MALTSFTFGAKKITNAGLARLNWLAAGLHVAQAILILVLADPLKGLRGITTNFLTEDKLATVSTGHSVLASAAHHLFDLNIAYIVAAFFLVNGLAHLLAATKLRSQYEADLKREINHLRWYDFALSSALMMLTVALVAGVSDIASLIMMFGLAALMGLTIALIEINKPIQFNYWLGITAGILPWLTVVLYLISSKIWGTSLPAYIYLAAISLFILFAAIAANFYLQYKRLGRWENYVFGERTYIILSFIAKTVLAWLIFFGALR